MSMREGGTWLGRRTSLLSPRPNHEKQPSPPIPQHQPGDHLGLEPSTATASSRLSSLGQVSSQMSRLELVLEEPQGPARHRRASKKEDAALQMDGCCPPCAAPLPRSGHQDTLPSGRGAPFPAPSLLPLLGSCLSPSPRPRAVSPPNPSSSPACPLVPTEWPLRFPSSHSRFSFCSDLPAPSSPQRCSGPPRKSHPLPALPPRAAGGQQPSGTFRG
ncbi:uncharacterized protein LOC129548637 [Moschus berezovskii]|uniref:uncharacterized protein LOC129548637 n=1 Tax=Moschus berezovskii TaxID=68408 RepID=UPI002444E8EA|nr:uncharacterized protein LOC129548637 [Moschus berezovskii]